LKNLFIGPVERYDKVKSRPEPRTNLTEETDQWNKRRI